MKLAAHRGMLCGDPFCDRCKGWYSGFLPCLISILFAGTKWIEFCEKIIPWSLIIGLAIFIVLAPIHGFVGRLFEKEGSNLLKFFFGAISALSLILTVASIVAITN